MRITSFDPGQLNFAFTKSRHRINPINNEHQYKITRAGHLYNTITVLKDCDLMAVQLFKYVEEIKDLIEGSDVVVIERFQGRGIKSGLTQETVNMMIGILAHLCANMEIRFLLVNPSTWKNALNKHVPLKELYRVTWTTPHILDSCFIGFYGFFKESEMTPYEKIKDYQADFIMYRLEEVCEAPLSKRRSVRVYAPRTDFPERNTK